jgi:hypothetical protein
LAGPDHTNYDLIESIDQIKLSCRLEIEKLSDDQNLFI